MASCTDAIFPSPPALVTESAGTSTVTIPSSSGSRSRVKTLLSVLTRSDVSPLSTRISSSSNPDTASVKMMVNGIRSAFVTVPTSDKITAASAV